MGRQALSEKGVRRYARLTRLPIERMLARGGTGHWILFRTADDRHGMVHAVPPYEVDWGTDCWAGQHWRGCLDENGNQKLP